MSVLLKRTSKLDETWPSYATLKSLPKSGIWPIFCQLMAILAKCFDIWTSNLFCPSFILTLIYKPSLKSIRPKLTILSSKKLQKINERATSQNPILPKCHSPKSLVLLHFAMILYETFRINVNIDFVHINRDRFLIEASKKIEPKIQ